MAITHAMVSTEASDATTTLIRSTDWNSNHTIGDGSVASTQLTASSGSILFGRTAAGAGVGTEIACTTAGRDLLDDAAALNQRSTLGLGTIATKAGYSFKAVNFLSSTAGTFTAGSGVSLLVIEGWGGGGGGAGGGSTLTANATAGAGGGSGGYSCVTVSTVTTSGYAYVCGTGGSAGTTAAKGTSGGISTWTSSSGTRLTVNGGAAGSTMATGLTVLASAGGVGGVVGTGGDINLVGQAGDIGVRFSGTQAFGGNGGIAPFAPGIPGLGGLATAGSSALGYACGGGGSGPIPFSWLTEKPRPQAVHGRARITGKASRCEAGGSVGYGGAGGGNEVRAYIRARGDNDTRRRRDERELIELLMLDVA